jgi:HPr kinase/phosphorylase
MDLAGSFHGQLHANCVERGGAGILLLGIPGAGKSDLTLRLLEHGFSLVADDRVDIADGVARAPSALAGLLEVRGLGILRVNYTEWATIALAIELEASPVRLPSPRRHQALGVPLCTLNPAPASAVLRVSLALSCVLGHTKQLAGAFAA